MTTEETNAAELVAQSLESTEDLRLVSIGGQLALSFEHNLDDVRIRRNDWTDETDLCPYPVSELHPFPMAYRVNNTDCIQPPFELYNALLRFHMTTHLAYYILQESDYRIGITVSFDNLQSTFEIQCEGNYS